MHFFFTQIDKGAFKKTLPLVCKDMHIMQLYSSNGVADIWTRAMYPYLYPWLSF